MNWYISEPNPPSGLEVTDQSTSSVDLMWLAPSDGEYGGYTVTINQQTNDLTKDITAFKASNLRPSAHFQFSIFSTIDTEQSEAVTLQVTTGSP